MNLIFDAFFLSWSRLLSNVFCEVFRMGAGQSGECADNTTIIDVRSQAEWDDGHIDGAIHIPLYDLQNTIEDFVPDEQSPIGVYCASGIRSAAAQEILTDIGYSNVTNLGGYVDAAAIVAEYCK